MSESECSESWYDLDADEQKALIRLRMHERNFNMRQRREASAQKVGAVPGIQENPSMS